MPTVHKPVSLCTLLTLLALPVCTVAAPGADEPPPAAAPDWKKGAFFGRVVDGATGKPLPDATVALQDKNGKVLAWAKTDAQGQYTLAADSLTALQLRPSRRRGLLERVARGVGGVVAAPVKVAAGVVKQVDPVGTAKAAVVSTVTANPAPAVAQVTSAAGKAVMDQAKATTDGTGAKARESAARAVLGERQATPKETRKTLVPGEVFLSVVAPNYKDLKDKAGAYWLEPSTPASDGKPATGVRAWLETVRLAPASAADKKSEVENSAVLLSDGKIEPGIAPAGSPVKVSVKLTTPGNVPLNVRLFAREERKRTLVELRPQEGAPGVFTGDLPLDAGLDVGDTVVTLVALKAAPVEVKLKNDKDDALLKFARGLDDLDAGKPYEFDPRILASENRLDLTLVVVDPKKATDAAAPGVPAATPSPTPTAPPAPAPAPAPKE